MSIILNNLAAQPIAFDLPPSGCAKSVNTGQLAWNVTSQYVLDPTISNQLLEFQNIQSVYVDNSQSSGALTISVAGTGQSILVPAYAQGIFPLIASDRPVIIFSNTSGNGYSQAWLMNTPAQPGYWGVNLSVSVNQPVAVNAQCTWSGSIQRTNVVSNLVASGGINTTSQLIISGSPGYFISGIHLQLTSNATLGSPGDYFVALQDTAGPVIFECDFYIANTPMTFPMFKTCGNYVWNNKVANSVLYLTTSSSLSTGALRFVVNYGLCNFVG